MDELLSKADWNFFKNLHENFLSLDDLFERSFAQMWYSFNGKYIRGALVNEMFHVADIDTNSLDLKISKDLSKDLSMVINSSVEYRCQNMIYRLYFDVYKKHEDIFYKVKNLPLSTIKSPLISGFSKLFNDNPNYQFNGINIGYPILNTSQIGNLEIFSIEDIMSQTNIELVRIDFSFKLKPLCTIYQTDPLSQ